MWKGEKLDKEGLWGESSLNWIPLGALLLKLHPRGCPAEVGGGWCHPEVRCGGYRPARMLDGRALSCEVHPFPVALPECKSPLPQGLGCSALWAGSVLR